MKRILLILIALCPFAGAAQIPITYLPYTISAPGTYVLNTDLTAPPGGYGILINEPLGSTIINLKGHTIHLIGTSSYGIIAKMGGGFVGGVTIQNGTLAVSGYGITVTTGEPSKGVGLIIQNLTFQNVTTSGVDIYLSRISGAIVKNCSFTGAAQLGVKDENSVYGNGFSNLSFDGKQSVNVVQDGGTPITVNLSSTHPN